MSLFSDDRFGSPWNLEAILKQNDISIPVQQHLIRVYATLSATVLMAGIGVTFDMMYNLAGLTALVGSIGLSAWLLFIDRELVSKRVAILMAAALCNGINIGPLVSTALSVDPAILVTALSVFLFLFQSSHLLI
jgi:hypothetical protein